MSEDVGKGEYGEVSVEEGMFRTVDRVGPAGD